MLNKINKNKMKITKLRRFKVNGAITQDVDGVSYLREKATSNIYVGENNRMYYDDLTIARASITPDELKELLEKQIIEERETNKVIVTIEN